MDTKITQAELTQYVDLGKELATIGEAQAKLRATPEYLALVKQAETASAKQSAIGKRLLDIATNAEKLGLSIEEKGKSKYPNLAPITEAGVYEVKARFGTRDSVSWEAVVEAIKAKNCQYTNGDNKFHPLNSVLPSITAGQTETKPTSAVTVELKKV